jgi:hypothetical protein
MRQRLHIANPSIPPAALLTGRSDADPRISHRRCDMNRPSRVLFVFVASICVLTPSQSADASWPPDGALVCGYSYHQHSPRIVSDGAGGMIVAWTDMRTGTADVYAQRLDGSGRAMWGPDGIPIRAGTSEFELVAMVTDGGDGAILLWTLDREDIYGQRVDGSGNVYWGATGTSCPVTDTPRQLVAVADGAGGVIFAWVEARGVADDIVGQRFDASGFEVWSHGGIYVIDPSVGGFQSDPCVDADGSGGAVFAALSEGDVIAQRVYASGAVWVAAGVVVTMPVSIDRGPPAIAYDGSGGAFVTWHEGPPGGSDIVLNWVDASGTAQWTGRPAICSATNDQLHPDIMNIGSGNTVLCWHDKRDGKFDIYAQRVDAIGTTLWAANGMPVCTDNHDQFGPQILSSGAPELVIAYRDTRGGETIAAQKIDAGGGTRWTSDGVDVLEGELYMGGYDFASDGAGGIIATVVDDREMSERDIYALAINAHGRVYVAEPTIEGVADVPGDQGGWVRIAIGASDRDTVGATQEPVARYDVWQEIDPAAAPSKLAAAPPSHDSPGGVVFHDWNGRRYITASPGAVVPEGTWELVGSFAAAQDTQYVFRASTVADSSASGTPFATYFVSAHTTNPAVWFASEADSGYSVDNIPPHVPTGLAVAYNTGSGNRLTWDACPDDDFKYFRIYRGETPGFVPSPSTYVLGTTDTEWWDTVAEGWRYHYRVSAVDMADNESEATGGSATGTGGPGLPDLVALYQNAPNPFNPTTTIRFSLDRPTHVSIDVYDVSGRRIRTLVNGRLHADYHSVDWDGKDEWGKSVSSGVYFYRLQTGTVSHTRKMVMLK